MIDVFIYSTNNTTYQHVSVPERSKGVVSSTIVVILVGSNPTADNYNTFFKRIRAKTDDAFSQKVLTNKSTYSRPITKESHRSKRPYSPQIMSFHFSEVDKTGRRFY